MNQSVGVALHPWVIAALVRKIVSPRSSLPSGGQAGLSPQLIASTLRRRTMRRSAWLLTILGGTVLALGLGCSANQAHESRSSGSPPAAESESRSSERFGYSWTLPKEWNFVPSDPFWAAPPVPSMDVYAAEQAPNGPVVLAIVTDVIHIVPGKHPGEDPKDYEGLESYGAEVLRKGQAELVGTERIQMFGVEGVQVTGDKGGQRISIRLLYRGLRRFEFRCFDLDRQPEWGCAPALTSFSIEDLPEGPAEQDTPRVLHLRDARFGVAFDAPDDTWLSIGPRVAGGGAQIVWIWNKSGRQIDVQAMDLAAMPTKPDQATFAQGMAKVARAGGKSVVENDVTFAGRRWSHLEMNSSDLGAQDEFTLVEQDVMYAILVTQPTREKALIEAAKKGFRLIPRSTANE